jgi:hypothetical protein
LQWQQRQDQQLPGSNGQRLRQTLDTSAALPQCYMHRPQRSDSTEQNRLARSQIISHRAPIEPPTEYSSIAAATLPGVTFSIVVERCFGDRNNNSSNCCEANSSPVLQTLEVLAYVAPLIALLLEFNMSPEERGLV